MRSCSSRPSTKHQMRRQEKSFFPEKTVGAAENKKVWATHREACCPNRSLLSFGMNPSGQRRLWLNQPVECVGCDRCAETTHGPCNCAVWTCDLRCLLEIKRRVRPGQNHLIARLPDGQGRPT